MPKFDENIVLSREMKLFTCKTNATYVGNMNLDEHPSTMRVLIPCLLTERGFYSFQPYMPNVNHRDIDHHVMQYEHDNGRAVLHAFAKPNNNEDFNNRPFILSPYQVKEVPLAKKGQFLRTFTTCRFDDGFKFLHAKNLEFEHVTGGSFSRLCNFFGYRWVNNEGIDINRPPTAEDISSFFALFSAFSFDSVAGFCQFLEEFGLEKLFEYKKLESLEWNIFSFGWLLRSLCNFRISITEGQHRWWCLSGVFQGLYESTSRIPLKFTSFEKFPEFLQTRKTWQTWKLLSIIICLPKQANQDSTSKTSSISALKKRSESSAQNSDKDVKYGVYSLLSYTLQSIATDPRFEPFTGNFQTYWSDGIDVAQSAMYYNLQNILNEYVAKYLNNDQYAMLLSNMSDARAAKDKLKKTIWGNVISKALKSGFGQKNTETGFPMQMKYFVFALKALCFSEDSCCTLPNLALADKFKMKQRHQPHDIPLAMTFRHVSFLETIHKTSQVVADHLKHRFTFEMQLYSMLLKQSSAEPQKAKQNFETILDGGVIGKNDVFHDSSNVGRITIPEPNSTFRYNEIGARACPLVIKVTDAFFASAYQNIMKTLAITGYDEELYKQSDIQLALQAQPNEFYSKGKKNFCLKLYLAMNDKYESIPPFVFQGYNYQDLPDMYNDVINPEARRTKVASGKKSRKKKSKSDMRYPKFTSEILLELYSYYLKHKLYVFQLDLTILKPFMGSFGDNELKITDTTAGFPDVFARLLPLVTSIFPAKYFFSQFVLDLRNDAFDCDAIEDFRKHMEDNTEISISADYARSIGQVTVSASGPMNLPLIEIRRPVVPSVVAPSKKAADTTNKSSDEPAAEANVDKQQALPIADVGQVKTGNSGVQDALRRLNLALNSSDVACG